MVLNAKKLREKEELKLFLKRQIEEKKNRDDGGEDVGNSQKQKKIRNLQDQKGIYEGLSQVSQVSFQSKDQNPEKIIPVPFDYLPMTAPDFKEKESQVGNEFIPKSIPSPSEIQIENELSMKINEKDEKIKELLKIMEVDMIRKLRMKTTNCRKKFVI